MPTAITRPSTGSNRFGRTRKVTRLDDAVKARSLLAASAGFVISCPPNPGSHAMMRCVSDTQEVVA